MALINFFDETHSEMCMNIPNGNFPLTQAQSYFGKSLFKIFS